MVNEKAEGAYNRIWKKSIFLLLVFSFTVSTVGAGTLCPMDICGECGEGYVCAINPDTKECECIYACDFYDLDGNGINLDEYQVAVTDYQNQDISESAMNAVYDCYQSNVQDCCIDLNNDGFIDIKDIMMVVEYWNTDVPPAPEAVDLDCSGNVTLADIMIMVEYWGYDITREGCPECCYEKDPSGIDENRVCCIDLNGDGVIDIQDIMIVVNYWNTDVPPSPTAVDLDCSGDVTLSDVMIMVEYWGYNLTEEDCPDCCVPEIPDIVEDRECCIDLNNDSFIDIQDIMIVTSYWNTDVPPAPEAVDLDCSGNITLADIMIMVEYWGTNVTQDGCPTCCYEEGLDTDIDGYRECCIDLNGDGSISIQDIMIVVNYWNTDVPPSPTAVDLDCSGDVTIADIMIMVNYWGYDINQYCPECCVYDSQEEVAIGGYLTPVNKLMLFTSFLTTLLLGAAALLGLSKLANRLSTP
jgi:hypothetical protein